VLSRGRSVDYPVERAGEALEMAELRAAAEASRARPDADEIVSPVEPDEAAGPVLAEEDEVADWSEDQPGEVV
jgi:hypothetical protein